MPVRITRVYVCDLCARTAEAHEFNEDHEDPILWTGIEFHVWNRPEGGWAEIKDIFVCPGCIPRALEFFKQPIRATAIR
jgi:hypothetical protein